MIRIFDKINQTCEWYCIKNSVVRSDVVNFVYYQQKDHKLHKWNYQGYIHKHYFYFYKLLITLFVKFSDLFLIIKMQFRPNVLLSHYVGNYIENHVVYYVVYYFNFRHSLLRRILRRFPHRFRIGFSRNFRLCFLRILPRRNIQ